MISSVHWPTSFNAFRLELSVSRWVPGCFTLSLVATADDRNHSFEKWLGNSTGNFRPGKTRWTVYIMSWNKEELRKDEDRASLYNSKFSGLFFAFVENTLILHSLYLLVCPICWTLNVQPRPSGLEKIVQQAVVVFILQLSQALRLTEIDHQSVDFCRTTCFDIRYSQRLIWTWEASPLSCQSAMAGCDRTENWFVATDPGHDQHPETSVQCRWHLTSSRVFESLVADLLVSHYL